jgi:hypothetical protein
MCGGSGDQGDRPQRKRIPAAYRLELTDRGREDQSGGEDVGVHGGVQPWPIVGGGEQPGAVENP